MSISGDTAHHFPSEWYSFRSSGQLYIHEKKNHMNKESNNFSIVSFQMLKLPQSLHVTIISRPRKKVQAQDFFFALTLVYM